MFSNLHTAAQAMIWVAIIDALGFTAITLILVRAIREQMDRYHRTHRDQLDVLIKLLARDEKVKTPAVSYSPDIDRANQCMHTD